MILIRVVNYKIYKIKDVKQSDACLLSALLLLDISASRNEKRIKSRWSVKCILKSLNFIATDVLGGSIIILIQKVLQFIECRLYVSPDTISISCMHSNSNKCPKTLN